MSQESKLRSWVAKQMGTKTDVLVKLMLRHVQADGKHGAEVATIFTDPDHEEVATNEEKVAFDIMSAAENDAAGLGGVQRYIVQAFYVGEDKPRARFAFRASAADGDGDDDPEGEEALSEPPSMRGITSQLMRHNEAIMRMAVMGANHTIETQGRTIRSQEETIAKLVGEKLETIDAIEDLRSRKAERDLQIKEADQKSSERQQMFDTLKLLLPTVANRLLGGKLLPEKAGPTEAATIAFLETLSPEQLEKMMGVLSPAQAMTIIEIMENRRKADEQAKLPPVQPS